MLILITLKPKNFIGSLTLMTLAHAQFSRKPYYEDRQVLELVSLI